MEGKHEVPARILFACLLICSADTQNKPEIKADYYMKEGDMFAMYCVVGKITHGVTFYFNNSTFDRGACLGPCDTCNTTTPGYRIFQSHSTAVLIIDSVNCTRDSGAWYCVHKTFTRPSENETFSCLEDKCGETTPTISATGRPCIDAGFTFVVILTFCLS